MISDILKRIICINKKTKTIRYCYYYVFLHLLKGQDDYVKPDIDAKTSHLTMIF